MSEAIHNCRKTAFQYTYTMGCISSMLTFSDGTHISMFIEALRRILCHFGEPVVLQAPLFSDFALTTPSRKETCSCLAWQTRWTVPLVVPWRIWNIAYWRARHTMMRVRTYSALAAPQGTRVSFWNTYCFPVEPVTRLVSYSRPCSCTRRSVVWTGACRATSPFVRFSLLCIFLYPSLPSFLVVCPSYTISWRASNAPTKRDNLMVRFSRYIVLHIFSILIFVLINSDNNKPIVFLS